MVSTQPTPAQQALQQRARELAQHELKPHAAQREANDDIPAEVFRALGERGLLGVNIPGDYGGTDAGVVAYALALREIAHADASVAVTMAVTNMVGEVIHRFGSEAQRRRHLPKLTSGEYYGGAFALSEPGAGSDAAALSTRADPDGGGWRLNGEKMWISTGDRAGVYVVWARTGGRGAKGLSAFLVESGAAGLRPGKAEDKMGLRASHTVSLHLEDVRVGPEDLLDHEGGGFPIAMVALDGGRIGIGSQAVGVADAAHKLALAYARRTSDAGRPMSEQQGVQMQLADMATRMEAAWLLTLRAAAYKDAGQRFSRQAAMAKVMASETANWVVREAVQLMGAYGYMETGGVARLLRDCRVTQIYEGTSEIQRLVIGRDVLQDAAAST